MHKSIRQSMAWLHSWTGLLLGWLLFAIFIMGTASYYRHEVNLWMQPKLAQYDVNQETAIKTAYQYLEEHATGAKTWYIGVASKQSPVTNIYWQKAEGGYESKTLDANTGKELNLSATQGGDFFYAFHYQLFGFPVMIGRVIVCLAAFIMFIALISGIITHKKIITDFFTLRTFKSQRSWLDFHNVSSVIALPFFLMITFTGLAIFFYIYLPWGIQKLYPEDRLQFFNEIRTQVIDDKTPVKDMQNLPLEVLLAKAQAQWGNKEIESITANKPNTNHAQITISQAEDHTITGNKPQITFDATTGKQLAATRNDSAIAALSFGVYGLHMATFAQPILRLAFFFSGVLGCFMIASGLLLWSLKRQIQNKSNTFHFGHYLVDRLNVATFVGLPIAMLAYMYSNRFVELRPDMPNYEIYTFFTVWLSSFILALLTKKQWLWRSQLSVFVLVAIALPFFNVVYLTQNHLISDFRSYWLFFRVDIFFILFAGLGYFILKNIHPIQTKSREKLEKKLRVANTEVNAS
ncbi:PepSY-associated TM helix domain-containing protein [Acinetobacter guerrae]|uniref:PepSY-associated TM helix domain-containing protein n=1 Tax=Acinetobacter guerrae TaxID=1843371 RepID=UPI00128C5B21|nr:PepSY-associated TM helix domain-containing protein [Acinetobacter guerrae]MPW44774.1 peptidase [Acinetobacter guerrae]